MNKNPFVPQPSYTPQQPPLPPGPPPPQPAQPDYTAYWAAAAAAQQAQAPHIQPALGAYNPQWNAAQPPRPPAEQSALYANYGYGNQQSNWQRQQQQQQQQQHYPPPPPPMVPQPPQAQPGYNPYQPTAGYPQPYIPQAGPQPVAQPAFPPPQPQQPFYMQQAQHMQQQQHQQQQQQQQQQHQNRAVHHTPPQHLPPAKRQRFDGPNSNQQRQAPPPQPQFSAPPPPPSVSGGYSGPGHGQGSRGGAPVGGMGGRGGGNMQRGGGGGGARGGRAGSMAGSRGGMNNRGGRGASMGSIGGQNRGGSSGQLRGHGSRGNFGGSKDFHNRRAGGQFGGFNHQNQNSSFRGRGSQNHPNRGSRHDGGGNTSSNYGARDTPMSSSYGSVSKKDENRRTLTDFKIVGLEIHDLSWEWGIVSSTPAKAEIKDEHVEGQVPSEQADTEECRDSEISLGSDTMINPEQALADPSATSAVTKESTDPPTQPATVAASAAPSASTSCPPSRIRIYFHTPVTPDDSKPIPHNSSSYSTASDSGRKGKRKKLEDDDGDIEEGRAPPPPPQMASGAGDDRSSVAASVAPSVAETSSEADWLMAAIAEGEGEGEHTQATTEIEGEPDREVGDDVDDDDEYGEHLHVSQIVEADAPVYDDVINTNGQIGDTDGSGTAAVDDHAAHPSSSSGDGHEHDGSAVGDGHTDMAVSSENQAGEEPSIEMEAPEAPSVDAKILDSDPAAANAEGDAPIVAEGQGPPGHDVPPVASLSDDAKSAAAFHASTEQVTDNIGSHDDQILDKPPVGKSLQAVSAEPTLLDIPDDGEASQESSTVINGGESLRDAQPEHLPEPPASPASNTLSASTLGDSSSQSPSKPDQKGTRTPSANRLSISYAGGNRRLVIDAEIVDKLQLFRQDGRMEVFLNVEKDKDSEQSLKGIIVEGLSEKSSYTPLPTLDDAPDATVPPFNKAQIPSKMTLIVHLDMTRPLSEPKWARSGDIQEWLKSMFGRMFWVAGDAAEGWEKKIIVVDPDPPPTIWTVLEGWAVNSPAGMSSERQRFLKTHMTDPDNVLEILLRLVRGERATPFSQSGQSISPPSVSGPLLAASQGSAHGAQQTHVSLAVLAIFRMSAGYATKALGDKGKEEAESRVGEIIRCLPSHLIYKSLDGIFKEWRVEKKGR